MVCKEVVDRFGDCLEEKGWLCLLTLKGKVDHF